MTRQRTMMLKPNRLFARRAASARSVVSAKGPAPITWTRIVIPSAAPAQVTMTDATDGEFKLRPLFKGRRLVIPEDIARGLRGLLRCRSHILTIRSRAPSQARMS
ncbi:MAG: hypothetical protein ACHREM_20820 [Polyangiales bacterium]